MSSGHPKRPLLNVEKTLRSPEEQELLEHIKAVNVKRLELEQEATCLHRRGDIEGTVRKKKACEEARRYLNSLVARHKKLYWRRPT